MPWTRDSENLAGTLAGAPFGDREVLRPRTIRGYYAQHSFGTGWRGDSRTRTGKPSGGHIEDALSMVGSASAGEELLTAFVRLIVYGSVRTCAVSDGILE